MYKIKISRKRHTIKIQHVTRRVIIRSKSKRGLPGVPGPIGIGLPTGGLEDQVLIKASDANFDFEWGNPDSVTSLDDLTNVQMTSPTDGEILTFDSGTNNWVNQEQRFTTADETKLDGIQAGATANATNAQLRDRSTHTGTQTAVTISDFDVEVSNNTSVANATAHIANTSNPHGVTKTQVGLGNVDNTSDASKPISTATQTALDTKVDENAAITGATKTKITYDAKGLVTSGTDATQDDIGDGTTYKRYSATEKTKLAGIATGATANSTDAQLRDRSTHTGTQAISTITSLQTALDNKLDDTQKGAANGLAELDGSGLVPTSQLPSYVDDVIEVANFAALPGTGTADKIYVTIDDNKTYRWGGSTYAEISASIALGETSATAYRGDRGKTAYDHSQLTSGNPHNVTKTDVGLGNVDNTSDVNKPVSTAQSTAINAKVADAINDGTTTIAPSQNAVFDALALKQPLDSDLTTIAGLTATTDNILQSVGSAWASRTPAQVKSTLALAKGDVGLGNVDNTSDLNKPISTATQTALDNKQYKMIVTVGTANADYITDGTADQTEINSAITAVNAAGGGTVLLKKGTYTTSAVITIKSNVLLMGEGQGSTIVTGASSDYALVQTTKTGTTKTVYNNIAVKGITFKSNYGSCLVIHNTTNVSVTDNEFMFLVTTPIRQTLFIQHCAAVVVDNNYAHDYTGNGLSVTSTDQFTISNNIILGGTNGDDGIDVDYDFLDTAAIHSRWGTVTGNVVRNIGRGNGIRVENSDWITVSGNTVSDVVPASGITGGILINTSSTNTGKHITVTGNSVSNCVSGGIIADGTNLTEVVITGNTVEDCGQTGGSNPRGGIILSAAGVLCTNNIIDTTAKTGTDGAAILVYKKDSHIISNNIIKNSVTGIRLWNGDALQSYISLLITDNRFDSNTTNMVSTAATATSKIYNNYGQNDFNIGPFVVVGPTNANYLTDGTTDNVEIQAAIDAINTLGGGTVFLRKGTYNVTTVMSVGSNTAIVGEEAKSTIIKKVASQNSTIFSNKDSTNGNSNITIRDLTIDQQGASQTAGGGASFTGLTDSVIDNVIFEKSYVFNLFIGSQAGTTKAGTITVTNGDATVTGSGTAFTTDFTVGSVFRTAGNRFGRIASIASNTSMELDRAWGHSTETAVTYKYQPTNSRNKIINSRFNGTVGVSDNVGLGLFDDSLVIGNTSTGSTGYGFGPDHTNRMRFIGNTMFDNSNAGVGMETVGYSIIKDNISFRNGSGIYILSGSYRNIVADNQCYKNTNGIAVTYNTTTFSKASENQITGNVCEYNTTAGINIDGVDRTVVSGNRLINNGVYGLRLQTGSSSIPDKTEIRDNTCYDNQDTKTQTRGIYVLNGTNTQVINNYSFTADHTTAGLTDSGTNTIVINTNGTTNAAGTSLLLPSQSGNSGKYLKTDGTSVAWDTIGAGTGIVEEIVAGTGITVDSTDPTAPIVSVSGASGVTEELAIAYAVAL